MGAVIFEEGCSRGGGIVCILRVVVVMVVGMFMSMGVITMVLVLVRHRHIDIESSDLVQSFQWIRNDEEDEWEEEE